MREINTCSASWYGRRRYRNNSTRIWGLVVLLLLILNRGTYSIVMILPLDEWIHVINYNHDFKGNNTRVSSSIIKNLLEGTEQRSEEIKNKCCSVFSGLSSSYWDSLLSLFIDHFLLHFWVLWIFNYAGSFKYTAQHWDYVTTQAWRWSGTWLHLKKRHGAVLVPNTLSYRSQSTVYKENIFIPADCEMI